MIEKIIQDRPTRLLLLLGGFFITNALIAEFVGVKIFSLEQTLGLQPLHFSLLGQDGLAFNLTAGVILWPFVFVMTDLINEYYGKKAVQLLSWTTVGLISYAFAMIYLGIQLPAAGFWPGSQTAAGVPDMNIAFRAVFGQGLWIIIGSMVAFLIGQLLDVMVFQWLRRRTGEKSLWLRATGSTLVSQLIDSFVVLFIAFYIGAGWSFQLVLAVGLVNYAYKTLCAVAMTPVIYGVHHLMDRYLGHEQAEAMRASAARTSV
ncbi:MAG: queuosine precursor transporter [Candidatus Sericytochromatia bacterium]